MGGMTQEHDEATLRLVFGDTGAGVSLQERARSSDRRFVRSQVQLTMATPKSKGRILTALEALDNFGFEALLQASTEGSFPLISNPAEPANTVRCRREQLNLPAANIARAADITTSELALMEKPGHVVPIRNLERVAQALALDERVIGYQPEAHGDKALGVRLRELSDSRDAVHFSANTVAGLSEAAWVIDRQLSLSSYLGDKVSLRSFNFYPDSNYTYPTYAQGYRLAQRARHNLGIGQSDPIESLRMLIEERLRLPLIQQQLDERFAGATLANRSARGIVVNESGSNNNVWIRRMTLCHELGHLLWDPDQRLNKLIVDEYDVVEGNTTVKDVVEIRANAFAIAFLAPPEAIKALVQRIQSNAELLAEMMQTFGISATAAKWHLKNVSNIDLSFVPTRDLPDPSDEWVARENLAIDFFPIESTPISRRGRFAWLVASAFRSGIISNDTASMYLKSSPDKVEQAADTILTLLR